MIESIKDRETQKVFEGQHSSKLPQHLTRTAEKKLRILHRAGSLCDLRIPSGNRLETLKGDRKGQWGIRINDRFRICFVWTDRDAHDVEIVDCHQEGETR